MSVRIVAEKMGATPAHAQRLDEACARFGITSRLQQAHFLGQIHVESKGFTTTREDLRYSASRLLEVFPGRNGLETLAQAQAIVAKGRDGIAEAIYGIPWGRKHLGNTQPGDGARFPGRGDKQLTGRANVTAYSQAMYGDDRIVRNPELLEKAPDASLSAAWYWVWRKCGPAAERNDVPAVTKLVNGGLNGLKDRQRETDRAIRLFAAIPDFSDVTARVIP